MTFKESVRKQGVQSPIWFALGVAEMVYRYNGFRLVVTSMMDSHENRPKSLHNKGLAVDIRTKTVPAEFLKKIHNNLHIVLNPMGFDVVLESDHIHIEFDPKPGESWQKVETA